MIFWSFQDKSDLSIYRIPNSGYNSIPVGSIYYKHIYISSVLQHILDILICSIRICRDVLQTELSFVERCHCYIPIGHETSSQNAYYNYKSIGIQYIMYVVCQLDCSPYDCCFYKQRRKHSFDLPFYFVNG